MPDRFGPHVMQVVERQGAADVLVVIPYATNTDADLDTAIRVATAERPGKATARRLAFNVFAVEIKPEDHASEDRI